MTTKLVRVKLTMQQAEAVDWAIGVMDDYWCTDDGGHDRDGKVYQLHDLPRVEPNGTQKTTWVLVLSEHDEINSDLLYRLEEQLPDMGRQASGHFQTGKASAAGRNAALRIRHSLKHQSINE